MTKDINMRGVTHSVQVWVLALLFAFFANVTFANPVNSLSELSVGSSFGIFPIGKAKYSLALSCAGIGDSLTSFEKANYKTGSNIWTLEDAGDGCYYIKNSLGCYWAYQTKNNRSTAMICKSKSEATKVSLSWNDKYSGVSFKCYANNAPLNNLYKQNYRYNWYGTTHGDDDDAFYIVQTDNSLLTTGVVISGLKYSLDKSAKTAKVIANSSTTYTGDVVIPSSVTYNSITYNVTTVGDRAFYGTTITSVVIPEGVLTLGESCFGNCSSLESVSLPEGLTSVGKGCFGNCYKLKSIAFPEGITELPLNCCVSNHALTEVSLPQSLITLGEGCFGFCTSLKNILIPKNVTTLGKNCFYQCYPMSVICLAATPPDATQSFALPSINHLYIPQGSYSYEKYKSTAPWSNAETITIIGMKISKTSVSIIKTTGLQLSATVSPKTVDNNINWTSDDEEVATVSQDGYVTGVKVGMAIIKAKATDGSNASSYCIVKVTPLMVESIELASSNTVMRMDLTKLKAKVTPAEADNQELKWSSETPDIAAVEGSDFIMGLKTGTASIKAEATDGSGVSATFQITVTPRLVDKVSLPVSLSLVKNTTQKLTAEIAPEEADNQKVTWKSLNTSIAKIDAQGNVTGVKVGTTTITATAVDGSNKSGSCTVTVTPLMAEALSFESDTVSVVKTEEAHLHLTISPTNADIKTLTLTSSDESVATVVQNTSSTKFVEAIVSTHKVGTAVIKATTTDGSNISASCTVNVTPLKVKSIKMPSSNTVLRNNSTQLEVSILPEEADDQNVKWSSSDSDIATVEENGVVTGLKRGMAIIRAEATDGSGVSASCIVYVIDSDRNSWKKTTEKSLETGKLTGGSQIIIYPYDKDGIASMALSGDLADKTLTSFEKAEGVGSVWTLEDTGDGYFYIVNSLGLYWAYQQDNNPYVSMTLTSSKDEAVKVRPIWNSKYSAVSFISEKENAALNNLDGLNYRYNWYGSSYTGDSNSSFHVYRYVTASILQSMSFNTQKMSLRKDASASFHLTYAPNDARVSAITVKSSDESVATVSISPDSDGTIAVTVTGHKAGTVTLTAESADGSNLSASCTITVVDAPAITTDTKVSSIDELTAGSTITIYPYDKDSIADMALSSNTANAVLTSTEKASDGSNSWLLEDAGNGYFYLVNGLGQYWAYQQSNNSFVSMKVTTSKSSAVKVKMVWNEKYPGVAFLNATDNTYLNNLYGYNYRYNWYNGDGNPLTYDTNNTYNVYLHREISMLDALAFDAEKLTLTTDTAVVLNLEYAPTDADASVITVKSSDESVATVATTTTSNGSIAVTVTGRKAGTATITAEATDGSELTASCTVTVEQKVYPVTDVQLSQQSATLTEEDSLQLSATITPDNASNKALAWSSSNESVAIVSNDGLVRALAAGEATITATSTDGTEISASCNITVMAKVYPVTGLLLSQQSATLTEEDTLQLTATVTPDNASNKALAWSSSNEAVAIVSNDGLVRALAAGEATITATTTDGTEISASCNITVMAKVYPVTGIQLSQQEATLMQGETLQLSATVMPDNASNKTLAWSSSDESVATVSSDGIVQAVAVGEAIVTATATDGSNVSANCVVTVKSSDTDPTDEKVTDIECLVPGTAIKIYPYGMGGEADAALSCDKDDEYARLGAVELCGEEGSIWTLEDASDGYFYIRNTNGKYWTNKHLKSSILTMTLASNKADAVKVKLVWNSYYSGVSFLNVQDSLYLSNFHMENLNNWYDGGYDPLTYNTKSTYDVYVVRSNRDSLYFDASEVSIDKDGSTVLYLTCLSSESSVYFSSSNEKVATISMQSVDGNIHAVTVKGKAAGTATITARAGDFSASCVVNVTETSGIAGISSKVADGSAYYTLDGIKLNGKPQQNGVYIRVKDGKSQKIVIKDK